MNNILVYEIKILIKYTSNKNIRIDVNRYLINKLVGNEDSISKIKRLVFG